MRAIDLIYHPGYNYKKVGVIVMELVPEQNVQSALFESNDRSKVQALMQTIDSINNVKGKETVRMGAQAGEKKYRLRACHLSRHYTTDINELPEINF
jgi:DNA polymerase V